MLSLQNIFDTIDMIDKQHLDIRTITMGISLLDCASEDAGHCCEKIYDKICHKAENLVKYTKQFIEKDGFMVVTDPEGKIITDMALLSRLRSLRYKIALKNNIPVYMIANNAVLVRLATDKPTTTEEFLAIPGIGSHRCEAYGQLFINAIKKYITNQKDD